MKRISILLAVLFACSGSVFAQFGSPVKAKDNLSTATTAAQAHASDAALYSVIGDSAHADGTAYAWVHYFYSSSHDSIYAVTVVAGYPVVGASTSSTVNSSNVVGTPWVNSDVAMATAEAHGGSTFRYSNPTAYVSMVLGKKIYPVNPAQTIWLITYSTTTSALVIAVDSAGNYLAQLSGVNEPMAAPSAISLNQNYPNPFSASTAISFTLNTPQNVTLAVYNQIGEQVATLVSGKMEAGAHSVAFDASNLSEGIYFYKLTANGVTQTRRMTVVK